MTGKNRLFLLLLLAIALVYFVTGGIQFYVKPFDFGYQLLIVCLVAVAAFVLLRKSGRIE